MTTAMTIVEEARQFVEESDSITTVDIFGSGKSLQTSWKDGGRRWLGDHWDTVPRKGLEYFVDNRTQNSIASSAAIQTENGVRAEIKGRETGDQDVWAIAPRSGRMVMAARMTDPVVAQATATITDLQLLGEASLDETEVQIITTLVSGGTPDPMTGVAAQPMIPGFNPEDLILISDNLFADVLNTIWQAQFDAANGEMMVVENELLKNIFGHQPMLFQWDDKLHRFHLFNPSIFAVKPDPKEMNIDRFGRLVFDQLMSLDEAIAMYPKHAAKLKDAATEGILTSSSRTGTQSHDSYSMVDFRTPQVTIRTYWKRYVMYPMYEHEAIRCGKVEKDEFGNLVVTEIGAESGVGEVGDVVTPDDKTWPKIAAIQQVKIIDEIDEVIEDMRCPYLDMPMGWNVNMSIPYMPFGIGETVRLEDVSRAINRLISMIYNVIKYNQSPQMVISQTMKNDLASFGTALHSHPNRILILNNGAWAQLAQTGFRGLFIDPPKVPESWVTLLQLLWKEHDILSNNSDVVQGREPFSGASGKTVEALQGAAQGVMRLRARHTEWMLERLVRLAIDAWINFMPESEWKKYVGKYPPVVFKMIVERVKQMEFDVKVILSSGRGVNETRRHEQARLDYQAGLGTLEGTLEKIGDESPRKTASAIMSERASLQAQAQPPAA